MHSSFKSFYVKLKLKLKINSKPCYTTLFLDNLGFYTIVCLHPLRWRRCTSWAYNYLDKFLFMNWRNNNKKRKKKLRSLLSISFKGVFIISIITNFYNNILNFLIYLVAANNQMLCKYQTDLNWTINIFVSYLVWRMQLMIIKG